MLSRGQTVLTDVDPSCAVPIVLSPGEFSLHHTLAIHASDPNTGDDDRIGIGISYIPTRVRHVGPTRLSATLVRGRNPSVTSTWNRAAGRGRCGGAGGACRQHRPVLDRQ